MHKNAKYLTISLAILCLIPVPPLTATKSQRSQLGNYACAVKITGFHLSVKDKIDATDRKRFDKCKAILVKQFGF